MVIFAKVSENDSDEVCAMEGRSGLANADDRAGSMPVRVWQPRAGCVSTS